MPTDPDLAPPLRVSEWLNTPLPLTLEALRGQVVMLHAFQMLCPGCVSHGLPQAAKAHQMFGDAGLRVIGLHTVFEHHAVTGPAALRAFVHEYRLGFPIGVDQASADSDIPQTMQALGLRGTPSLVLIDRQGRVRLNHFGQIDDLVLGVVIGQLLAEVAGDGRAGSAGAVEPRPAAAGGCDDAGCARS